MSDKIDVSNLGARIGDKIGDKIKPWQAGALLAGLGLAASYLFVRAKTQQAEAENPPRGRFVTVDGVRLHYVERGQGPALVLIHGNGVYADDFEASGLLERAARHYRVIVFDRPGFGYSERPRSRIWTPQAQARLLHHALQEIGVDQAIVVGHSLGALIALSMGLDVPGFVRGLVLLSGYYYPSLRPDVPLFAPPSLPLIGDLMRYTVSPLTSRMLWRPLTKQMFSPKPVPDSFRRLPVWMMLRPKQVRAASADNTLMVPAALALSKRYHELTVPVTIVAGTQDRVADPGHNAERLHERIEGSELKLQPGVGHMTHYANPEQVLEAIEGIAGRAGEPVYLRDPRADARARASESGV